MELAARLLESFASRECDFRRSLDHALAFLRRTTLEQLIDSEPDGLRTRDYLERFGAQIEHVGLLAPPGATVDDVQEMAIAAGFALRPRSFVSKLVALELSTLHGATVPTMIYRSDAEGSHARRVGIEVFIPKADASTIRRWIACGVASHVAIELKRPDDMVFGEVATLFESAGFTVPGFLINRPVLVTNPIADLRTVYFDRGTEAMRLRVEVCAHGDLLPRPLDRRGTDAARAS